jgi:hypothetical protein
MVVFVRGMLRHGEDMYLYLMHSKVALLDPCYLEPLRVLKPVCSAHSLHIAQISSARHGTA